MLKECFEKDVDNFNEFGNSLINGIIFMGKNLLSIVLY